MLDPLVLLTGGELGALGVVSFYFKQRINDLNRQINNGLTHKIHDISEDVAYMKGRMKGVIEQVEKE